MPKNKKWRQNGDSREKNLVDRVTNELMDLRKWLQKGGRERSVHNALSWKYRRDQECHAGQECYLIKTNKNGVLVVLPRQ